MNYHKLPIHMQAIVEDYIEKGIIPDDFTRACLENKLVESFSLADEINMEHMKDWANWLYNDCPMMARGSKQMVDNWIEVGGIQGSIQSIKTVLG